MILAALSLLLAMSTPDAVSTLLNAKSSVPAVVYDAAWQQVKREADEGNPLQQFVIGVKTNDETVAKHYLDASRKRIYDLAAQTDNALAWYLISVERSDVKILHRAAELGNVQALNALGSMSVSRVLSDSSYATNGLERILAKSCGYFRRAAQMRDPNGYINLGTCYLKGLGCKQDMAMAFACFKAAAEAGHPEGMDNVSACYQFGHGVEKDNEQCLLWAMRGRAARGDKAAAKWLEERK